MSDAVALETIACQAPLSTGFPGKNTRVACHALLQGIFPTRGLSQSLLHLPHCRWTLCTSEPPDPLRQISSNAWLNEQVLPYPPYNVIFVKLKNKLLLLLFTDKGRVDLPTRKLDKICETSCGSWTSGGTEMRKTGEMSQDIAQPSSRRQLLGTSA